MYVVDGQVVSDNVSLHEAHRNRIVYYNKLRNRLTVMPRRMKCCSTLRLNWQDEIGKTSAKRALVLLALRTLEGARAYQQFERSKYSIR